MWPDFAETVVARFDRDALPEPVAAVVIPCFDMAEWIGPAVSSALAQTVPVEIVVRDDASRDNTVAAAAAAIEARFGNSLATRVSVVRGERNLGLGLNFSLALRHTRSRWVFNFDADDVSSPERVATTLGAVASVPDAAIAFVGCVNAEILDQLPSFARLDAGDLGPGRDQPWRCIGAGMAIDRGLIERLGPLGPAVLAHDHHLRARALAVGEEVILDRRLVKRRVHEQNVTHVLLDTADPKRLQRAVADQWSLIEDIAALVQDPALCSRIAAPRYRALVDGVIGRWYSLAERRPDWTTGRQRAVVRSLWRRSGRGLGWLRTEFGGHLRRRGLLRAPYKAQQSVGSAGDE
jgi:glycosyltransferase involved in cell wall biosynthesis